MCRILICFSLVFVGGFAWAHDDEDHEELEALMMVYRDMVNFEVDQEQEPSVATPYVRIKGHDVAFNGPSWELRRGWFRVYYRALQNHCDDCLPVTEEQFIEKAEEHHAQTWTGKILGAINHLAYESVEHVWLGVVDLTARYGRFAGGMKGAGEAAETVVSLMKGGMGAHFICNVIDAAILFFVRGTQIVVRSWTWAGIYDRTSIGNFVKSATVASIVKKAQRRVRFVSGPVEVDEEMLKALDGEGQNRWWGIVPEGKRAAWVRKLVARAEKKGEAAMTLDGRKVQGKRKYLWLKARKRGTATYLQGNTMADKLLKRDIVWIMEVQNLLDRTLIPKGEEVAVAKQSLAEKSTRAEDDIRRGLAEEFAGPGADAARVEQVENLLRDVEVVFNRELPSKVRYFHAAMLENLLNGIVYESLTKIVAEKGEMYGDRWSTLGAKTRMHWYALNFGEYMYDWIDFVRMAALQNNPDVLRRHRYEAMESLLRIFKHFQVTAPLAEAETTDELEPLVKLLNEEGRNLKTFTPWRPKHFHVGWFGGHRRPMCQDMAVAK